MSPFAYINNNKTHLVIRPKIHHPVTPEEDIETIPVAKLSIKWDESMSPSANNLSGTLSLFNDGRPVFVKHYKNDTDATSNGFGSVKEIRDYFLKMAENELY